MLKILSLLGFCPGCNLSLMTSDLRDGIITCPRCGTQCKKEEILEEMDKSKFSPRKMAEKDELEELEEEGAFDEPDEPDEPIRNDEKKTDEKTTEKVEESTESPLDDDIDDPED